MKKLFIWIAMIGGIAAIIGSCSSETTTTTATTTSTDNTTAACTASATASGTISGIDNLTGTFSMSWDGATSSDCISNSSAISALSAYIPGGTLSFKNQKIITSSSSYTDSMYYYSDSSCATNTAYLRYGYTSFAVGDNVSGLTAGSSPARPTTAAKVSYTYSCLIGKGETDNGTTFLNNLNIGTFTKGTEKTITGGGTVYKNIWATADNVSGSTKTWLYEGAKSSSSYPSDWGSSDDVSFK